jgi:hypothetical protein
MMDGRINEVDEVELTTWGMNDITRVEHCHDVENDGTQR